jgi:hypothetical protein
MRSSIRPCTWSGGRSQKKRSEQRRRKLENWRRGACCLDSGTHSCWFAVQKTIKNTEAPSRMKVLCVLRPCSGTTCICSVAVYSIYWTRELYAIRFLPPHVVLMMPSNCWRYCIDLVIFRTKFEFKLRYPGLATRSQLGASQRAS